jgi:P4 family phage/plasmid primase-like protien
MEFPVKPKNVWEDYCKSNNCSIFQKDLNSHSKAKIAVADTYENIYDKIKAGNNYYYEYWLPSNCYKLYIDYDKKVRVSESLGSTQLSDQEVSHKNDIINIINHIQIILPNLKEIHILKSIPDTDKKSYHIIFEGRHFTSRTNIKKFIEDQVQPKFKELFDKKIIDTSVYGNLCFRMLMCAKRDETPKRPLYLLNTSAFLTDLREEIIPMEDVTFDMFRKTCITCIDPSSEVYNYKQIDKKKETNKKVHLINDGDIYSDKEIIKKYLDILDPDRYNDYSKWIKIGFILHSINREYLDLWHYFSSKYEKYDEVETALKWDSFENSEYIYTIHNLMYLARLDNPEDCDELGLEIPMHDIKYLRPFDNIISKLIYRLYGENFVCSNPERNEWYFFNGIRWVKENKSFNLRKLMINDVFTKVENYRKQLLKDGASEELVKNYHNILKILGSGNKLNCLELEFYNSKFYKIIDQNKDLLGFENGVYDLVEDKFRKGLSSDYISLSTGYEFVEYAEDHPYYVELFELICKILPQREVREFTLKSLASCLDGHNRDENFYIWSGKNASGANGKSTLSELLLKSLGDYACISPVSLITGKRENANNANSALANIRNKRAVIMQEPAATDQIQVDVMKSLTGGDRISTRELNSTQIEFKPNAKFFMSCNKLINVSDIDGGTLRRLKITEFVSVFVENPNTENLKKGIYEFKIDKELKSKLETYKAIFMNILLNYYRVYKREGLIPPEPVMKVTIKFEADNNIIKQFIDENVVSGKQNDFITKEELKMIFSKDYTLKSHFGKLGNFITQLENTLCAEMKLDTKKGIAKLNGFYIRNPDINKDDEDEDDDDLN